MENFLFLSPYFEEKVWGGSKLKNFNFDIGTKKIGEAWVISAIENKSSKIDENADFFSYFNSHRNEFDNFEGDYPLLAKILDCNEKLSVQVHPTRKYSLSHPTEKEKNEAWYVLDCDQNSELIYGHTANSNDELVDMIMNKKWDVLFKKIKVKKNDCLMVESGTVHALCEGLLIYEIQQSSDTTYRIYDYDREKTNPDRKLHINESINNITVPSTEHEILNFSDDSSRLLIKNDFFTLHICSTNKCDTKTIFSFPEARWLQVTIIEGEGEVENRKVVKGESFVTLNSLNNFNASGNLKFLVSYISKNNF